MKVKTNMKKMNDFYPTIKDFSIRNYTVTRDKNDYKVIKGSIYYKDVYLGIYRSDNQDDFKHTYFDHFIEENPEYQFLADATNSWRSIFTNNILEDAADVGLKEMLRDLQYLALLYDFMHKCKPSDRFEESGLIGIINNEFVSAFKLLTNDLQTDKEIIDFFHEKIEPNVTGSLDFKYPIYLFKTQKDFIK